MAAYSHSYKNFILHSNHNFYTNIKGTNSVPNMLKKHTHTHKSKCLCNTHHNVNHPIHIINQDSLLYERDPCYKTVISIVNM